MGRNFLNPFALTPQGTIATTTDPDRIALQRVESIVETPPRERVMLGDYGVDLPAYLFSPGVETATVEIKNDISGQLARWEPNINVIDVIPDVSQEEVGIVNVDVEFTQSADQAFTPVLTATVLVGGTVVNE